MKWVTDLIAKVAGFQPDERARIVETVTLLGYLDDSLYLTKNSQDQFMNRIVHGYVTPEDRDLVRKHPEFFLFACAINNLIETHIKDRAMRIFYDARYQVRKFFRPRHYTIKITALDGKEFHEFDDVLFYSTFAVLVKFVETECRHEAKYRGIAVDILEEPGYVALRTNNDADRKALAGIYWWYKNVHLRRRYAGEEFISAELAAAIKMNAHNFKSQYDMVAETDALFYRIEEQEMLLKLCDLRHVMWA